MARPRQYASGAERQAAYRHRLHRETVRVDRHALDRLHTRLEELKDAVREAADRGDPFARRCVANSVETVVEKLIVAFNTPPQDTEPIAPPPDRRGRSHSTHSRKEATESAK